ncbi:ethanolamine ammonia-lyase subunit EutC [Alkaliphilus serpentinus]|uniref:Ethanolamine ammonia-lyase small subunit n=1 Tax=Alkaliphilus serpentinus TaxID=1482731 RepID=A0A833HLB1_9FIRM|nr:ethanolamine ammonia-lyase subunit EutC [Alkaliphilus serpentinus]KAB3525601.1 ethanolamine ammonia-lyase subunit EutC [Alkaliphilus serpentinus]
MLSEVQLKKIIEKVITEISVGDKVKGPEVDVKAIDETLDDKDVPDITEIDLKAQVLVPNPENLEGLLRMKQSTPARIGVWRAGPRYMTETLLRFRADHAVAMDAVFTDVSEKLLKEMNLFSVKTRCKNKDEYLTRPDLGRKFDEEAIEIIKKSCIKKPQVQIYASDGLSSTAIEANIKDILPAIMQGLEVYGVKVGTPFFVKYGRVPAMDVISEVTEADVTCVLIGERPGLATGESMSAYIAYKATVNMPESRRTVVSNIHKGGTPAVEAGAHIADIIKQMLDKKASGLDLKL